MPFATAVVSQGIEYGAEVSCDPKFAPSILNCTPAIPVSSEALAVKFIVPETVERLSGELMNTAGGEVSPPPPPPPPPLLTVTATELEVVWLLLESRAIAVRVYAPFEMAAVSQEAS